MQPTFLSVEGVSNQASRHHTRAPSEWLIGTTRTFRSKSQAEGLRQSPSLASSQPTSLTKIKSSSPETTLPKATGLALRLANQGRQTELRINMTTQPNPHMTQEKAHQPRPDPVQNRLEGMQKATLKQNMLEHIRRLIPQPLPLTFRSNLTQQTVAAANSIKRKMHRQPPSN